MEKSGKMKNGARDTREQDGWDILKEILLFPWRVIKAVWRFIVRICRAIWKWLKSIDVVGMVNLTLLVAIIVLFSCLISNFIRCGRCNRDSASHAKSVTAVAVPQNKYNDKRNVVPRRVEIDSEFDQKNGVATADKTVENQRNSDAVDQVSITSESLPRQNLYGDVIVDMYPSAPVLSDGAVVDGNLYIQNMRKYTLPCNMKITGHLFVRNVERLKFCGAFTVKGNIYVNRQSSFGPIPRGSYVGGQVRL